MQRYDPGLRVGHVPRYRQRYTAVTAACMNTIGSVGAARRVGSTGTIIQASLTRTASALQVAVEDLPATEKHAAIWPDSITTL